MEQGLLLGAEGLLGVKKSKGQVGSIQSRVCHAAQTASIQYPRAPM